MRSGHGRSCNSQKAHRRSGHIWGHGHWSKEEKYDKKEERTKTRRHKEVETILKRK